MNNSSINRSVWYPNPSKKAVYVYIDVQIVYGRDYTFNEDGFAVITASKAVDDRIDIPEYETTIEVIFHHITKLGLYPNEPQSCRWHIS